MPPDETAQPVAETPVAPVVQAVALDQPTILSPVPAGPAVVEAPGEPVVAEAVETPAVETAEVPDDAAAAAAAAAAAIKPHTETPSLLEQAGKDTAPEKAGEVAKPVAEAKPETAEAGPTYEPFKLPEGVTADDKTLSAFHEIAGRHKLDQEAAQQLVDLHTSTLQAYAQRLEQRQHDVFAETRRGWAQQIMADPELGGAGHRTAIMAAARMRDLLVPEAHRAEFAQFMAVTGAGDHPALVRLLHNAARIFDEPAAPPITVRPVPDRGGAKPSRSSIMYDHPTSRRVAGRG